jgi:hypothetical protein
LLALGQFPFQGFWATVPRPPFPVAAIVDFFSQVVVGFDRFRAAAMGACLVLFPVEPDLLALANQSLWVPFRAIRNVQAAAAPGRGLFAAGEPRYKLFFGLYTTALCTHSMSVRDCLFGGQALALFIRFSDIGTTGWTELVFGRVHARASIAFLGCHNLNG